VPVGEELVCPVASTPGSILSVFGSVVAGAFQIIFYAKIHVNNFFLFFKNHF
jgi:hypothetical protein